KSDRPGADRLAREVAMMLHLRLGETLRNVPAHHGVDMKRAAQRIGGATRRARAEEEGGPGPGPGAADMRGTSTRAASHDSEPGTHAPAPGRPGRGPGPGAGPGPQSEWEIPGLQTIADQEKGIAELAAALDGHRAWLHGSGELDARRRRRVADRVRDEVRRVLERQVWQDHGGEGEQEAPGYARVAGTQTACDVAAQVA